MRSPVDVQFTYEDLTSVAELSNESGVFILKIVKKASNPASVEETERLFGEAVQATGRPEPMNVNFHKSRFDGRLLRLSVLRAAYLTGVAVAGYRWMAVWDRIRRQILDATSRDASLSHGRFSMRPPVTQACHTSFDMNTSTLAIAVRLE